MTRFVICRPAGRLVVELDVDAVLDRLESEHPGRDLVPLAAAHLADRLEVTHSNSAVERLRSVLNRGIARGRFPPSLKLEAPTPAPSSSERAPMIDVEGFDVCLELPSREARVRWRGLVGLDRQKRELLDVVAELADPVGFASWGDKHHPASPLPVLEHLKRRPPLVVLAGDVGSGKTEIAETFGDVLGRNGGKKVAVLRLGLTARGAGLQGLATQRVQMAFTNARKFARTRDLTVMLLDEADALAQSREESQMHHEDRAGVNSLLQGIDACRDMAGKLVVVMCTNRGSKLDPAILRRAAAVILFGRPDEEQRRAILEHMLGDALPVEELPHAVAVCDGHTASDIVNRVLPAAIRAARREDRALKIDDVVEAARRSPPTPAFADDLSA